MHVQQLHVHPTQQRARLGDIECRGDQPGSVNAGPGTSLMGMRAEMIYIHGGSSEWEEGALHMWLRESVMTRLVDTNPARVVWLHDA